eukprot:15164401-Alexandrium_andersonii.AAC.1
MQPFLQLPGKVAERIGVQPGLYCAGLSTPGVMLSGVGRAARQQVSTIESGRFRHRACVPDLAS